MAFITEETRKKGLKYRVHWYNKQTGKRYSKVFDSKKQALAFKKTIEAELTLGIAKSSTNITFGDYAPTVIELITQDAKPYTKRNYLSLLNQLDAKFGRMKLVDITSIVLNKYFLSLKQKGLKLNTLKKYRQVLNVILDAAYKDDILTDNPMNKLTFKFTEPQPTVEELLEREEKYIKQIIDDLAILLNSFETPYYKHIVLLGKFLGTRKGETCALMWDVVDLKNRQVKIIRNLVIEYQPGTQKKKGQIFTTPKTPGSIRTIPIHDLALEVFYEIKAYQEEMKKFYGKDYQDNNLVICKPNGEPVNIAQVSKTFYEKNKTYGTSVTTHKLRHLFASKLKGKVDPDLIRQLLGHTNRTMTLHYQDYKEEDNTASQIEQLNKAFIQ